MKKFLNKELTDQQMNNLFNGLVKMCDNVDKAKKMSNKELKDYIIESDIYSKQNIYSFSLSVLEEVLERLNKTEFIDNELALSE